MAKTKDNCYRRRKTLIRVHHQERNDQPLQDLACGITAAIIDDAIGATLIAYGEPHFYVTVNLAIDYFYAAKETDVIIAETSINKKGKQIVNAQCEIWNADKTKLLARGYTNLLKTDIN